MESVVASIVLRVFGSQLSLKNPWAAMKAQRNECPAGHGFSGLSGMRKARWPKNNFFTALDRTGVGSRRQDQLSRYLGTAPTSSYAWFNLIA
jgi:hypothetical protein